MQNETLKDVLDTVLRRKDLKTSDTLGVLGLSLILVLPRTQIRGYTWDLQVISEEFEPRCIPDNIIVLDAIPYKIAFNPFYSSLYLTSFYGDFSNDFLKTSLIPYLSLLANFRDTLWCTVQLNHPNWSSRWSRDRLQRDWNMVTNIFEIRNLYMFIVILSIDLELKSIGWGSSGLMIATKANSVSDLG